MQSGSGSKFATRLSKAREEASSAMLIRESRDDISLARRIGASSKQSVAKLARSYEELQVSTSLPIVRRKPSVISTFSNTQEKKLTEEPTTSPHRSSTRMSVTQLPSQQQPTSSNKSSLTAVMTQVSTTSTTPVPQRSKLSQLRALPKNLSPVRPGTFIPMLPPQAKDVQGKVTLCIDIDETLVHSSFLPTRTHDVVIPICVEGQRGKIYVKYRPNLMKFLEFVTPLFEVVIFTASLSVYAESLMNHLDPNRRLGNLRLFREHCTDVDGSYAKDLSLLGRSLDRIALIDNSPSTYMFQQRNGIPIESWFDDPSDNELMKLKPLLTKLAECTDVYSVLDEFNSTNI